VLDEEVKKRVIEEIKNGKSPIDIVIEYKIPPDVVEELYKEIYKPSGKTVLDVEIPDEMVALFILASIITALDIITTRVALLHPYTYEVNPIMRLLMNTFGVELALLMNVVLSLIGLIAITLLSVYYMRGFTMYIPLIAYSALRLIPVIVNYRVLLSIFV